MDSTKYEQYKWLEAESRKPQPSMGKKLQKKISSEEKKIQQRLLDYLNYM